MAANAGAGMEQSVKASANKNTRILFIANELPPVKAGGFLLAETRPMWCHY
jgi:hypothetical protein